MEKRSPKKMYALALLMQVCRHSQLVGWFPLQGQRAMSSLNSQGLGLVDLDALSNQPKQNRQPFQLFVAVPFWVLTNVTGTILATRPIVCWKINIKPFPLWKVREIPRNATHSQQPQPQPQPESTRVLSYVPGTSFTRES